MADSVDKPPDTRVEGLSDELAVPRRNGEIQFQAPWEARVFGMAVAMYDDRQFAWDDFRTRLVQEIADADQHGDESGYYERWLGSFERLLLESGLVDPQELDQRTGEFAAGLWDPHEHYETTSDATASSVRTPLRSTQRNVVWRSDGEAINVFRRPGQLFVCATGCCCGHTERGHFAVPVDLYHQEWARRKIRHKVHLSMGGCLGPCALSNVALLLFAGEQVWFHSIETDADVLAIFDYVESLVRASAFHPPPDDLRAHVFDVFDWNSNDAIAELHSSTVS